MPRKTKNARRGRNNGGNRKQQRKTMRRKNVGGFSFTDSLKKAQSFAEDKINTALSPKTPTLQKAQSFMNKGTEFMQQKINQGKNFVSDKQTQMAISEINKKQGDERVNVLNQILKDEDINKFLVAKPEIKQNIIHNGLNEFLRVNSDIKTDIIRKNLYDFLNANPDAKNEIITVENIEKALLDQQNFRLKFINKFHNYKVNEVNGRLEERKSSLCKRDRIPVV